MSQFFSVGVWAGERALYKRRWPSDPHPHPRPPTPPHRLSQVDTYSYGSLLYEITHGAFPFSREMDEGGNLAPVGGIVHAPDNLRLVSH